MVKFVSAYVERGKKNLKLAVFGVQVAALLIDFATAAETADFAEKAAKSTDFEGIIFWLLATSA